VTRTSELFLNFFHAGPTLPSSSLLRLLTFPKTDPRAETRKKEIPKFKGRRFTLANIEAILKFSNVAYGLVSKGIVRTLGDLGIPEWATQACAEKIVKATH
jgi:hypothetical protein